MVLTEEHRQSYLKHQLDMYPDASRIHIHYHNET